MIADFPMIAFLAKGGIIIVPILGCSVAALAIFFERLWTLRTRRVIPSYLTARLQDLLGKGQLSDALATCVGHASPLARVFAAGLRHATDGRARVREAIEYTTRREAADLDRFIEALGTIASVSTLLGLLGTISGMIKIFGVISEQSTVNPPALAAGISEALITTLAGLSVAIPTLVMYRYLQGRVDGLLLRIENQATTLFDLAERHLRGGGGAP